MTSLNEAFTDPSSAQSDFYAEQQIRYQEVEPNRILSDSVKGNLGTSIKGDALQQFDLYDPYTESVSNKFTAAGMNQILQGQANTTKEEDFCRTFVGVGGLPTLIRKQDSEKNIPIRCGWRYKKSPGGGLPLVSQGALGTINGPLNAKADPLGNGVEWIWNLKTAQDRHARDYRSALPPTADGLAAAQAVFPNTAYSTQTNTFVSVDSAGNPLRGYTSSKANLITNPSQFPQVRQTTAASLASQNGSSLTDCMKPGQNPSLSRDCLLQAVRTQGCSADGTLYQAIESTKADAQSYDAFLVNQASFQMYQSKQGSNKITQQLFNKDRGNWDLAVGEIQKLQRFTQTATDPSVRVAAQDLCTSAGAFDEYDFCSEIPTSTPIASVELKCLQKMWQSENGKPAGLLYPARRPLNPELGRVNTWGEYQNAVKSLSAKTKSSNPVEQRTAINNFFGVSVSTQGFSPLNLDALDIPVELAQQPLVFWVDAKDGSSLTIDGSNRVVSWGDKSGRKNTLSQNSIPNRPVYKREAFPGLEFNGTNQFLPIPNAFSMVSGNFTVFVVEKRKSNKYSNYFLGGTTGARDKNLVLGYASSDIGLLAFWQNDLSAYVPHYQNTLEPVRIWAFENSPSGRAIYINGSRASRDGGRGTLQGWNGAAIGRYGTHFYSGIVYEVLIYNTNLASDKRQKIEGYLADKWGLSVNLPAGHPFKTNPP